VFGSLGAEGLFREDTPYQPNSPYSASKAASDHLVRAWHHTYGLPTVLSNCSNNYGPYHFPEKLIPLMILNALAGKPLPVYGDGMQIRDWLYVEDHCRAILTVLDQGKPGETYNIGGHNEMANIHIVHTLCALLDELRPRSDGKPYTGQITYVTDRPGHDRRYAIDAGKIGRAAAIQAGRLAGEKVGVIVGREIGSSVTTLADEAVRVAAARAGYEAGREAGTLAAATARECRGPVLAGRWGK